MLRYWKGCTGHESCSWRGSPHTGWPVVPRVPWKVWEEFHHSRWVNVSCLCWITFCILCKNWIKCNSEEVRSIHQPWQLISATFKLISVSPHLSCGLVTKIILAVFPVPSKALEVFFYVKQNFVNPIRMGQDTWGVIKYSGLSDGTYTKFLQITFCYC